MNFRQKLNAITDKNNSLVCVGLDSDFDKLPKFIKSEKHPQFIFNKAIIDTTHDLICAYKPNIAFYEARSLEGLEDLKLTFDYLQDNYPEIVTILDAKRADIGNTNRGYVKFAFDFLGADAITLHPYLGKEALKPFLERRDKGIFILCRTSNPGSGEFQDLLVFGLGESQSLLRGGEASTSTPRTVGRLKQNSHQTLKRETLRDTFEVNPIGFSNGVEDSKALYQLVAEKVAKDWNYNKNCGLVVGATYPKEIKIVRRIVGDLPLLIPGIGTQGGNVDKTIKFGIDSQGKNAIINSSRGIIFSSNGKDFAEKARRETDRLRLTINACKEQR